MGMECLSSIFLYKACFVYMQHRNTSKRLFSFLSNMSFIVLPGAFLIFLSPCFFSAPQSLALRFRTVQQEK